MLLKNQKTNKTIELKNEIQIAAYKNNGWVVVETESTKAPPKADSK